MVRVEHSHRIGVPRRDGFDYKRGLPDVRHERHFSGEGESFDYRLVVEYEPRAGLRGFYDRALIRRGVERALRVTVENLERTMRPAS